MGSESAATLLPAQLAPANIVDQFQHAAIEPNALVGILIALIGAAFLSLGAQLQHRGVRKVEARTGSGERGGLGRAQLIRLLTRPSWLLGTAMLGLAILFQLTALLFAPLIVVQPIGVVALVVTTLVNARVARLKLGVESLRSVGLCVGGVAVFVVFAAVFTTDVRIDDTQLLIVAVALVVIVGSLFAVFRFWRGRLGAVFYVVAAGICYGFVATLAKVTINRLLFGEVDWLSLLALAALLSAMGLGMYFVQTAYSVGSPDLVIAGLTVVDPMVAVAIAILVLREAQHTPAWVALIWAFAGAVAVFGVFQLAKYHPQTAK